MSCGFDVVNLILMLLKFVAIKSKSLEKDKDDFFCNSVACLKSFLSPPPYHK